MSVRIVYLNSSGKLGGAETSLRQLLASVRRTEPAWELWLILGEDGPLAAIARELGVRVLVMPFPPALAQAGDAGGVGLKRLPALLGAVVSAFRYSRRLAAEIRRIQPDLVHANGLKMHLLGAWACPARIPLVWHIHDYLSSRPFMKFLLRLFRRRCTLAIANSNSVRSDLATTLPGVASKTIYNAIDMDRFTPEGGTLDLDRAAGLPAAASGTIRVGLIATFARWKGQKIFLDALAAVPETVPLRGYIIGGPIYQTSGSQWSLEEMQQEAARLHLSARVGFTGFVEDIPAAMRSLDIVVHASTQPEPFGMVIIEGMACGKPVIASQAGGAVELFEDGQNALAHAPGDASGLARQILRLANDQALRSSLGQAGRRTAKKEFQGSRLAGELVSVYREIATGPRVGKPESPFGAVADFAVTSSDDHRS